MVLGLSISRKGKKKDTINGPVLRSSPSLPELHAQGIPWPENLVDLPSVKAVRQEPVSLPTTSPGANNKISFGTTRPSQSSAIPFHKPFRPGSPPPHGDGETIASIYTSRPPSAFSRVATHPAVTHHRSIRRKIAPTFNLMVTGAKGTGKTSLLKLLLDTCEISPNATPEQRVAVDRFMAGSSRRTRSLQTACVEILEPKFDRVLLTLIDTPGLDFSFGHELETERAVSSIVKYLDLQFADTMGEESKVVRQSKGDQHVHLCIYLIDPDSVVSAATRRARSNLPTRTQSHTTFSLRPDEDLSSLSEESTSSSEDEYEEDGEQGERGHKVQRLTMSPADIRVIKRLSKRVNVLPVISHGDMLIDSRLAAIKRAVKRDLSAAGLDFGVFSPPVETVDVASRKRALSAAAPSTETKTSTSSASNHDDPMEASDNEDPEESDANEERARPVIKIRSRKLGRERSRSRRRREDGTDEDEITPMPIPADGQSSIPTKLAKTDLVALLPFAIVAPEPEPVRRKSKGAPQATTNGNEQGGGTVEHNGDADSAVPSTPRADAPPSSFPSSMLPQSPSSVARLPKPMGLGKFVRRYRWGTIDVLDSDHCDFMALRTAVLSSHLRALKSNTKDVLYEKYRTEKLLARRATRNISDDDRKRLLQDLGL